MNPESETTYIEEAGIHQCNFCGAYAETVDKIKHHSTCTRKKGMEQYEEMFENAWNGK